MQIEYMRDIQKHKTVYYRFIYLEPEKKILIDKLQEDGYFNHERDMMDYVITITKDNQLSCECPGFRGWKHCKHVDFATEHLKIGKHVKPKKFFDKVAEEFMIEKLYIRRVGIVKALEEVTHG